MTITFNCTNFMKKNCPAVVHVDGTARPQLVRKNVNPIYFSSNLDTFGGNSGSAVFNADTGEVEGILVRGEADYVNDRRRGCKVPNQCSDGGCRGEEVTRITNIKNL